MSQFSEESMVKHLFELTPSIESIQTCSLWLQHHRKHSQKIAEIWLKGFAHVAKISDEKTLSSIHRVLQVWRERQLYSNEVLDKVNYAVQSHLANKMLTHWTELLTKSPQSPGRNSPDARASGTKESHDYDVHKSRSGTPPPSKRAAAHNNPSLASGSGGGDQQKVLESAPSTPALLAALQKLTDPPSADAEIREQIAAFPPDVADTNAVKKLKNQSQSDELRQSIRAAEPVVQDYCDKLAAEIEHRRETQRMLAAFVEAQKIHANGLHELLQQFRQRRDRLVADKNEAQKHYDSLPDMSKLDSMAPSYLPPLPTVGELFHS